MNYPNRIELYLPVRIVAACGCDTVAPLLADRSRTAYTSSPSSSLSVMAVMLIVCLVTPGSYSKYPEICSRSVREGVS